MITTKRTTTSRLSFTDKARRVYETIAVMESSKVLCLSEAVKHFQCGNDEAAYDRLEKAAQYAWGFSRPANW